MQLTAMPDRELYHKWHMALRRGLETAEDRKRLDDLQDEIMRRFREAGTR